MSDHPILSARQMYALLGLCLVAYVRGLFIHPMDVDAAQYASISVEMLQNGSWLEVMHRGRDYLDKPPLLFWLSALSFSVFGIADWAYKLPSLLFSLLALRSVYGFAKLHYDVPTARLATVILATAQGFFLMNHDVRTDTLLHGSVAFSIWQLSAYLRQGGRWHFVAGFVGLGLGMLAKGPIGLMVPVLALGSHLLLGRRWRDVWRPEWLLGLLIVALLLLPMAWGLYTQFDLQPDKVVNHKQGVSGLYFYFWEQSFGRITGENTWKDGSGPDFFLHTFLWVFLPWPLFFGAAFGQRLRALWRGRFRLSAGEEGYTLGGFVLPFVALSMSSYKLPHYIYVVMPLAAVLTAAWLQGRPLRRGWRVAQGVVGLLYGLLALLLLFFVFGQREPGAYLALALFGAALWGFAQKRHPVWVSALVAIGANVVLNFHFYPQLLRYQSASELVFYMQEAGLPTDKLLSFRRLEHSTDYYARRRLTYDLRAERHKVGELLGEGGGYVYVDATGRQVLQDSVPGIWALHRAFPDQKVTKLSLPFLNPASRAAALDSTYLLHWQPEQEPPAK